MFFLKGAARPAQEFYKQPGLTDEPMPRDILQEYHGRLYEHCESKKLLEAMLMLGIHLHNVGSKTKQAIQAFLVNLAWTINPEQTSFWIKL